MSKTNETRPQEPKQPKTVLRASYIRDIILATFISGVIMFLTGYFTYGDMQAEAQSRVIENMELVKEKPVKK